MFYVHFLYSSSRLPPTGDVAIIHEVYDSENAQWKFENELELALDRGYKIIVIEPSSVGDETARWIAFGNCLHKTAILSGLSAVCTGMYVKKLSDVSIILAMV